MTHLEYCELWNLKDPRLLAHTRTAWIYRVLRGNEKAVLKILTDEGCRYEGEAVWALRCFDGKGAVRLLEADGQAQLLSFVEGMSLKEWHRQKGDESILRIALGVLEDLHGYRGSLPSQVKSLRENFGSLFVRAEKSAEPLFRRAALVAEHLLAEEKDVVLLHGDLHHENILGSPEAGWCALDPQPLIGEKIYDVANLFFNPLQEAALIENTRRIEFCARLFADSLRVSEERVLDFAFAFGGLSTSWCLDDGVSPHRRWKLTRLIEKVRG